jgi:hypothetical protein
MRRLACRCGVALLALVVGPLLGCGAAARAGYLGTTADLASNPGDTTPSAAATGSPDWAERNDPYAPNSPDDARAPRVPSPFGPLLTHGQLLWVALAPSGTGAGTAAAPSGGAAAQAQATVDNKLAIPPLAVVDLLYIDSVQCRPPPFACRLFRPPRLG